MFSESRFCRSRRELGAGLQGRTGSPPPKCRKTYRIFAAEHGVVNVDAPFWQMGCDEIASPAAMLQRTGGRAMPESFHWRPCPECRPLDSWTPRLKRRWIDGARQRSVPPESSGRSESEKRHGVSGTIQPAGRGMTREPASPQIRVVSRNVAEYV